MTASDPVAGEWWSAVRFSKGGVRMGWCGHRHRFSDLAEACTRRLNREWAGSDDTWVVQQRMTR